MTESYHGFLLHSSASIIASFYFADVSAADKPNEVEEDEGPNLIGLAALPFALAGLGWLLWFLWRKKKKKKEEEEGAADAAVDVAGI